MEHKQLLIYVQMCKHWIVIFMCFRDIKFAAQQALEFYTEKKNGCENCHPIKAEAK